jgi:hypothetical protein
MTHYLPTAVRAFTEARTSPRKRHRRRHAKSGRGWLRPARVLLLDCETETVGHGQHLSFGSYRYCALDKTGHLELLEEGLFHADELPSRDPAGYAALDAYARENDLVLLPRRVFVERVFWRASYKVRAWVVGFNLPFDVSRLAVAFGEARGLYSGGHSLVLWNYQDEEGAWHEDRYRPRVLIKSIDSKRAFIGFSQRRDPDIDEQIPDESPDGQPERGYRFRGHFLDLRTLAFALTNRSHSLASACNAFRVDQRKHAVEQHGVITPDYIDYNRQDVHATAALFEALLVEYHRHPIALSPTKAYSPAAIAKAYLKAMGIRKPLERQANFPREVLGAAMVAYYGGRAECRIRCCPAPVAYVDFLSMYPTVNTLMGLWRYVTAARIATVDASEQVRQLVERVTVDACFQPDFWPQLLTLVQVEPDGDVLPTRADYSENGQWQIGLNPLHSDVPLWYSLADIIASTLLTGRPPRTVRALRLVPEGQQPGLRAVRLAGEIEVDPTRDDFFATLIEQRRQTATRDDLEPADRERIRTFLKVLANSGCYGIFAEINRDELGSRQPVTIHGLNQPFTQRLTTVEAPGEYSFPPLAACITGAARLMLALLERLVTDAAGRYAFCDTDSMAIVATPEGGIAPCHGGPLFTADGREGVRALSYAQFDRIIDRFTTLNPYNRALVSGSILEPEEWNFEPETSERLQLYCYAISAKRYALYNLDANGRPILRKWSEHGLGHLLNPLDPDADDRDLARHIWQEILDDALGFGQCSTVNG